MIDKYDNEEFFKIIKPIINNEEFKKLKNIEHHGVTRYDHSLRVSYYSYKISKILKLDYKQVATGGLLHDFFLSDEDRNSKDRFLSTFNHPKRAVLKASEQFDITEMEKDIIRTHMFPINLSVPKYAESWIVSMVDKVVGVYEFSRKFGYKLVYATNLLLIFLLNSVK